MAYNKVSPNSLIHCEECGEDYSATYRRCPFCGARNEPSQSDSEQPAAPADLDDNYVFEGQELFDEEEGEDAAASSKGGKRLAGKSMPNPFASRSPSKSDINWPRVITFICSLIIIVAAMVIVFTGIYPLLSGKNDPVAENTVNPSAGATNPAGGSTQGVDPSAAVTAAATDPVTEPSATVAPTAPSGLRGFTTNIYGNDEEGFALTAGESWQMRLTFDPAGWSGEVTYSVSDTRYATVSAGGNVTNVSQESGTHKVMLTITAGDVTKLIPVYCYGGSAATQPPATQPPATQAPATQPPATQAPATQPPATQAPTTRQGTVINAANGLNIRSGPGTNYDKIGSLVNGATVNILADAGDGWYKISYGTGEGYVSSTYISVN